MDFFDKLVGGDKKKKKDDDKKNDGCEDALHTNLHKADSHGTGRAWSPGS